MTVIQINDPAWGTFQADVDTSAGVNGHITTGAEPWNIVCSPDGKRMFVANSAQDTITVIDTATRAVIGHVDLRNSLANDPDRNRHFQPRGVGGHAGQHQALRHPLPFIHQTRRAARRRFRAGRTRGGARYQHRIDEHRRLQSRARDLARAADHRLQISRPDQSIPARFPNQLQSIVIRGDTAYLPNIAASPTGPLRFNLDTHAFVNLIGGVNGDAPADRAAVLNLHLGAREPEAGQTQDLLRQSVGHRIHHPKRRRQRLCRLRPPAMCWSRSTSSADGQLGFTVDEQHDALH